MTKEDYNMGDIEYHWCPGCGNFPILDSLKDALVELKISPEELVIMSGIGQAGKTPHFMKSNFINGLHGRTLPMAMAAKALNPELTVLAVGGDGDMYSEGGNHLMHAIRRNINVTTLVYNNMVYGLTKGQASPTSPKGLKTSVQVFGVASRPFNPIAFALSLDASFVARAFAGDKEQLKNILKQAIQHKGFALVDIFQPCVSFNKVNTYKWFKEHTYYLEEDYKPNDCIKAFQRAMEKEKLPLGIFYQNSSIPVFEEVLPAYQDGKTTPVIHRKRDLKKVAEKLLSPK